MSQNHALQLSHHLQQQSDTLWVPEDVFLFLKVSALPGGSRPSWGFMVRDTSLASEEVCHRVMQLITHDRVDLMYAYTGINWRDLAVNCCQLYLYIKSILRPHLHEPELWVHRVDVLQLKSSDLKQEAKQNWARLSKIIKIISEKQKKKKEKRKSICFAIQLSKKMKISCSCQQRVCLGFLFRVNRRLAQAHTHAHKNPSVLILSLKKWCHSQVKSVNPVSLGIVSLII